LIAFLHLWLKFCKVIDKYGIVPVRKLFYFHHWLKTDFTTAKLAATSTFAPPNTQHRDSGGFKVGRARGKTKEGGPLMTLSYSANRDMHFDQA